MSTPLSPAEVEQTIEREVAERIAERLIERIESHQVVSRADAIWITELFGRPDVGNAVFTYFPTKGD